MPWLILKRAGSLATDQHAHLSLPPSCAHWAYKGSVDVLVHVVCMRPLTQPNALLVITLTIQYNRYAPGQDIENPFYLLAILASVSQYL
jgi:hypothetical protein